MPLSFLDKLKSLENEQDSESDAEEFGTNSDVIITTPKRKRLLSENDFSDPPRQPILNNSPVIRLNTPIRKNDIEVTKPFSNEPDLPEIPN